MKKVFSGPVVMRSCNHMVRKRVEGTLSLVCTIVTVAAGMIGLGVGYSFCSVYS